MTDLLRSQAYVAGRWVDADSGETFPVVDPATGAVVAEVPRLGAAETRRAIEAAHRALPAWKGLTAKARAAILRRLADLMDERAEELAALMVTEQGKPLAEARAEVQYALSFFEWFGEEAKRLDGAVIPTPWDDKRIVVTREPVGVTAGITPWNFPAAMPARPAAPWCSSPPSRPRSALSRSPPSPRRRASPPACSPWSPVTPTTRP